MEKSKVVLLLLLLGLLFSCKKSGGQLDGSSYIEYVRNDENGLYQVKQLGDFKFELQYEPLEYQVLKVNKRNPALSQEFISKNTALLDSMYYFVLRIRNGSGDIFKSIASSREEYYGLKQYFIAEAQKDIDLGINNKKIDCGLYHYESSAYANSEIVLTLGFPIDCKINDVKDDLQFIYEDRIFGFGPLKFLVKNSDLKNIPTLKMSSI